MIKRLINIGHMYAGIEVCYDYGEALFRVTTDSKGGNNERVVEFNSPDSAAAEILNMANIHALSYKLPAAAMTFRLLSEWLEEKILDVS